MEKKITEQLPKNNKKTEKNTILISSKFYFNCTLREKSNNSSGFLISLNFFTLTLYYYIINCFFSVHIQIFTIRYKHKKFLIISSPCVIFRQKYDNVFFQQKTTFFLFISCKP